MDNKNSFDWSDDAPAPIPDTSDIERLHRVFKQNPDGAIVLAQWRRQFVNAPRVDMDPGLYKVGFLDGQAHLAKMIINVIESIENE